jgi:hypothetical protein
MPSVSQKQHNLMEMVAHNPAKAKQMGIPQSVGKEYVEADKGKKFGSGQQTRADRQVINRPDTNHGKTAFFKKGGVMKETMGPRTMSMDVEKGSNKLTKFGESAVQKRGKTKGKNLGDSGPTAPIMSGMKKGGKTMKFAEGGMTSMGKVTSGGIKKHGEHTVQTKGHTKAKQVVMSGNKGMKKGGKVIC